MKMTLKPIKFNIEWDKWLRNNPYENNFTKAVTFQILKFK
jgi:hypothetical protein